MLINTLPGGDYLPWVMQRKNWPTACFRRQLNSRAAVLDVSGLEQPLLVEGSIADVEHAVAALNKVGIAARGNAIQVQAHSDQQAAGDSIGVPQDREIQNDLN